MRNTQNIFKWLMIASWAFTIIGIILYTCMFAYFHSKGFSADEDIMESGIAEGWWQNIIFMWFALCYLLSAPIAIISSTIFLIQTFKKRKSSTE